MQLATSIKNWEAGSTTDVLAGIHNRDTNIAVFNRSLDHLLEELDGLQTQDFELRFSGSSTDVSNAISHTAELSNCPQLKQDIISLLHLFSEVSNAGSYRLFLATIDNNMCKKFHTDINDLRMLCTYVGPGTLWLTEDNVNRDVEADEDSLVIDESRIQQADTGSVILLKGAIYPKDGTNPILHRSPTIEESGVRRLLLRIDTDEFANF